MSIEEQQFPLYRKYSNERSYFKVSSVTEFEEMQVFGQRFMLHQFEAKILPDRNFIMDMINNAGGNWINISEKEYQEKLKWCEGNLDQG